MARIYARLDEERMAKLEQLKEQLHFSTTEVLKLAIDDLYQQQVTQSPSKLQQLLNSDFIACGEAEPDLSANHKEYLVQTLAGK
ncbi:hypothetical protein QX776_04045 [Alteromonadaceae bacterium BrNp21-10]|nr:hypothetical protein [Alteromonadaceae bacterium BrNp21-10]